MNTYNISVFKKVTKLLKKKELENEMKPVKIVFLYVHVYHIDMDHHL